MGLKGGCDCHPGLDPGSSRWLTGHHEKTTISKIFVCFSRLIIIKRYAICWIPGQARDDRRSRLLKTLFSKKFKLFNALLDVL